MLWRIYDSLTGLPYLGVFDSALDAKIRTDQLNNHCGRDRYYYKQVY